MISGSLWLEITIAGFPYLLSILFLFLGIFRVPSLSEVNPGKDYLPYVSAGAVAVSYILGVLAHRMTQIVLPMIMRFFENRFSLKRYRHDNIIARMAEIWQDGSDRLNKEVDFQYALLALFRSLLLSIPLLGASLAFWLNRVQRPGSFIPIVLAVLITPMLVAVYRRQQAQLYLVREAAFSEMIRLRQQKPDSKVGAEYPSSPPSQDPRE